MSALKRPKLKTGLLASGSEFYYLRKPTRPTSRSSPKEKAKDGDAVLVLTRASTKSSDAKTVRARKGKD